MSDFINTNPQVLKSIRESLQLDIEKASKLSKIPIKKIKEFEETNNIKPSFKELKSLAKAYNKSLAELLLYKPIKQKPLPKDRRTVKSEEAGIFDLKTIKIVDRARSLLDSLLQLKKELGISIVKFSDNATLNDDPVITANKFRIKWKLDELQNLPNSDAALEGFIEKIEELGVAVFQLPLTKDNLRGFSITDEEIPIIVIKRGGEPATAKIFTLFHEVGHLLLNESGICDISFGSQQKIEKWCNTFASEILVPKSQLLQNSIVKKYVSDGKKEWSSKDLIEIGNEFFVGRLVILKKLYDLRLTTKPYYEEKLNSWNKPVFGRAKEPRRNIPKEIVKERGKTFISLAFDAYRQNRINIKELSDYLGAKLIYIPKIREYLYG